MPDLSQYQVPGVYVQDVSQPLVTSLGVTDGMVCIVGKGLGYQSAIESIQVFAESAPVLQHPGVIVNSIVVKKLDGTTIVKDTDYSVLSVAPVHTGDPGSTAIGRLSLGVSPASPSVASPAGVADGDLVQVTYHYTDANYFAPQVFSDYDLLAAVYGPAMASGSVVGLDEASQVLSPLTLAAKVAFENGAPSVLAVCVDPGASTIRAGFAAAYGKVRTDYRANVIVPIIPTAEADTGAELMNYVNDLKTHCLAASADGYGRIGIVGAPTAFNEGAYPFEDIAGNAASKRIVAVYPTRLNIRNDGTSQIFEADGFYAAAALGGILMLNPPQVGLTRKVVNSFQGIPSSVSSQMTLAFKNNLSSQGVCVIEQDRTSRLVVRHGLTTDVSALNTREISLVRIADSLLEALQVGLDNSGLIGDPIDLEMPIRVKGAITGILEQQLAGNLIEAYANVLVRQGSLPSGDPSVIDCKFDYQPAVPLNYITVEFSLNLNTGIVNTRPNVDLTP